MKLKYASKSIPISGLRQEINANVIETVTNLDFGLIFAIENI